MQPGTVGDATTDSISEELATARRLQRVLLQVEGLLEGGDARITN
jgi:hypothetical protein